MGLLWSKLDNLASESTTVMASNIEKMPAVLDVDAPYTGLPKPTGMSLSYWLQGVRANPLLDHRTTPELPSEAEVVIIGSGLTGCVTAMELLKSANPPKSIVMLEARETTSAATGRNAGHCKPDQYRGFKSYAKKFGTEQALKLLANEKETFDRLVSYVRTNNVDCDLWVGKTLDVCMTDEVAATGADIYEACKAAGGDVSGVEHITDKTEAAKRSRIKSAVSVFSWDAGSLYPWKLAAHILNACLTLGLNLQTWTPVTSVTESPFEGKWTVTTDRGCITASSVVFATNAYTGALLPEFSKLIRPKPHMCNKVVPPRAWSGTKSLQNTYGVIYPDGMYSINSRSGSDGIVLFGGSNPAQHHLMKYIKDHPEERTNDGLSNFVPVTQAVVDLIDNEFEGWGPMDKSAPGEGVEYSWSGIIGWTTDGLPCIGQVPGKRGLWICAGHNGHGMARIFTCAPGLVKLMQGGTWQDTKLPEVYELTPERLSVLLV